MLLEELSADCPKREADLCGINCPDLPSLFLPEKA
jgi:hypothetical protein